MASELKMVQPSPSSSGDVCTYMWACAICDETETCQKDREGHSRWLVNKRMERIEHKILVMSNKGGVGKTTIASQLAYALSERGHSVMGIDLDGQRNFTSCFSNVADLLPIFEILT